MQDATAQAIEQHVEAMAGDWGFHGTMDGQKSDGSQMLYVQDSNGRTLIVGSGEVAYDPTTGRAKEGVGDMLVCFDPNTREMAYVNAEDTTLSNIQSVDDFKNEERQRLQQINSVPYNQAAAQQAARDAAKAQSKEEDVPQQEGQPQQPEDSANYDVANSLQEKIGGSLTEDEAKSLTSEMESRASMPRQMELTPENWYSEFGEDGKVKSPIGEVKMGENQIAKLFERKRSKEFGMIKPTIEDPDAIIEVGSSATDGNEERPSSYLFVKTFLGKNGEKVYYFKSVTVKKDGMEISISSHYDRAKRVMEELKKGKLLYLKRGDAQTEQNQPSVSGATSEEESAGSSVRKDTNNSSNGNGNNTTLTFEDGNPVPMTKDSKGRATPDYANMKPEQAAEILGKQFGESAEKVVDGQIKKAEKAVKDAEKMKVDYTAEPNDILEQEQQKKAVADAAKKQLEHAQAIKKALTQRKVTKTMAKPEGEAAEGANEVSGAVAEKFANATRLVGNKRTRTLANSEKISGHYEIVPAESLTPSHDAMNGYRKSEGFPVDENGRTVNDRDYENDKAAQQTTDQMALKYNGQAIDQVPVVSDEGIVYDGNGRTMAGQKAAKDGTDGEYISDLLDNAENFGFTREQIEKSGIEHPRLVLVTDERMPYDTATFAKFNRNEKKTQSNTEQAVAKAKTLTADEVGSIVADIEGNGSLDAFFNNPKAINDLVKTLVSKGIIGQNEVAELMEGTDRLSPQGKELVKNLLLGSIFKPETIRMMGIDSAIKNKAIAGIRAVMDNMKLGDYSLRDEIDQAVQLLYEARQNGDNVDTLLRTPAMFGENAANRYPSVSQMMALALEGKVSDFRDLLNEYNREAAAHNTGEGDVFGDVPTKEELIRDFLNYKKWKDYDTRGNSEAEGGNDAEGIRKTEPEAQGGNGEGKPTESQRQVGEAVKKLATDITKQTGVTVHTNEKESQKALEDAEKNENTVREHRGDAGGSVIGMNKLPKAMQMDSDYFYNQASNYHSDHWDSLFEGQPEDAVITYISAHDGKWYFYSVENGTREINILDAVPATRENYIKFKKLYDNYGFDKQPEIIHGSLQEIGDTNGTGGNLYESFLKGGVRRNSEVRSRTAEENRDNNGIRVDGQNGNARTEMRSQERQENSINKNIRQFRTKDGEVYGFVVDGEIHLDTKKMKPETPLHEYTHLWTSALQRVNAKEWENVKGLLDSVDGLKEEVKKLYPELKGDDLYDEMLATYSGREGTKKLEAEARRLAAKEGKTVSESARAKSFLGKVKEALKRYWNGVADMLGLHFTSAEEIADKVLADWASGENPNFYRSKEELDRLSDVEQEWKDKIDDYIGEKYPQHTVERARTKEEQAAYDAETEAMKNDATLKQMRKDADVAYEKVHAEIYSDPMASLRRNAEEYNNKVRMQKADSKAQADKREAALRDAVVEKLRKGGMDVSMDAEEGQRVLDEANGKGETVRQQARLNALAKAENSIRNWLAGNKRGKSFTIELPFSTQRMIKNVMGRDFDSHNITANGVAHAKKNHGVGGNKVDANSIPLRDEDFELMPYIMTSPDYVRRGSTDISGRESVRFYKELHNGYVVVAEKEYKNSPNDMETITMWAEKSSSEATNARRNAPDTHVRNAILSTEDAAKIRKDAEKAIENDVKLREQRVYHGSGAGFDRFDHSHMGEGEGAQAYGWGTYVTEVEGIGRTYAKNNTAKNTPKDYRTASIEYEEYRSSVEDGEYEVETRNEEIKKLEDFLNSLKENYKKAKEKGLSYRYEDFENRIKNEEKFISERKEKLKIVEATLAEDKARMEAAKARLDSMPKPTRHLYTVEIPDDTGENYLEWDKEHTQKQTDNLLEKLFDAAKDNDEQVEAVQEFSNWLLDDEVRSKDFYQNTDGRAIYNKLAECLGGSDRKASELLHKAGFTGIKYPADFMRGGREDGKKNYVIFNEGDARITDHVRFFRTKDGEAYGYTIGGKIYIDPRIASSETPIHEYAHLWATALRKGNAKEWQNVVGLMRDTKVWDEVRRKYPELEADDDIADEVLATYSGRRGAERLRKEMGEADGEARGGLERVKQALRKFWKATADMLHIHYTSAEDVADRVMKDLLDGMDPREFGGVSEKVRKQFIGERGAEKADHAEEVNTRLENLRVARNMETEGKDAKAVKMATGWERGADGKWRYEIQDIKYHPKGDAEYNKLRNKQLWAKELGSLEDRLFDGDQLTKDESKRFDELAEQENKFKADFLSHEKKRLADWVENQELFEAYPELKNVEMVFTDQLPKDVGGYYSVKDNRLVVNTASNMDTESVIAHELQHAIQRMEGFAKGGSTESVEQEFQKAKAEWAARAYAHQLEETAKELGEGYSQAEVEKALVKEYEEMGMSDWLPDGETRIKGFNYFARGYADRSLDDAIKRFRLNESTRADFNPYLEYHKLAGEVESRNVQNRMSMTPAERRASLASETEDVAREDQIFLNGSDDANPMDALARAAEEYHDGQRAKLQKKNRDDDGRNEELFVSLRNKKGKEYYDTVTELARRMAEGAGEISRTERAEGNVSEGQGNQWKASLGRNSDGRGRRYKSVVHCAAEIIAADIERNAGDGLLPRPSTGMERGQEDVGIHSASSSSVEISPADIPSVGVDAPVEREVSKRIENWAKRNNAWLDRRSLRAKYDRTKRLGTGDEAESDVFLSNDGKSVLKIVRNPHIIYRTLLGKLDGVALQNRIFTDDIQNVIGVTRVHEEGVATVGLVLEQPFVDGKPVGKTFRTYEEVKHHIDTFMKSLGFKPELYMAKDGYLKGEKCEVWRKSDIIVDDVHGNNVLIDLDGKKHVIDCSAYNIEEWDKNYEPYKKDSGTHFRMELGKTFSNSKEDFDGVRDRAVEENGIVMPNLNKERVKVVPIEKHSFGNSDEGSIDVAKKWAYDNIVTKGFSNEPTMRDGTPYVISKKAIDKYLSSSATSKSENLGIHLSVLSKLTDVIRESIEAEIHPDYKKGEDGTRNSENGYGDNVLIHRLYGAVELDGKMYRVKTTMQEFRGGEENKPHSYEVTKIELLEGSKTANESDSLPLNSASNSSENELPNSPGTAVKPDSSPLSKTSDNSISVAKLLNGVEKSYDAGKKLLDESKDLTDGETSFRTINNSSETESTSASTIVADHVEKVSAKVGSKVRMVNSAEEVTNPTVKAAIERGEKVTGWYDEKTGEVHLYMPNIHDRYTAEKTIWHETVGHKAMRGLIGDENYSKFLRSIWYDLDKPENARLKELVSEELKYNPFDFENAVEEGIARLVEDGKGEPGFWNNIRNKVADIFRSIGYHIAPNTKDVKYLLWLSKNLQKNPNNPYWKMRAEAVRYRLEHEKYTTIKNGMFADNDGKTKDYSDFTRKDWEEATDMTVHFRTTPAAATEIEIYNRAVGNVKAMAEEAYSDKMNSVLELYKAIAPSIKRAEDVKTSENPYMMENLMSSRAQQVGNAFVRDYMEPATKALGDVLGSFSGSDLDEKMRNANLYIVKKSGLERNRVFFVRDQIRKLSKKEETQADAKLLQSNWDIEHQTLKGELDNKQITLKEYFDGLDDFIRKNIDDKYKAGEHDYSGFHEMQGVDYNDAIDDANIQDEVMSAESSIGDSRKVDELWRTINAATDYSLDMEYEGGFMDREMNQYVKGEMNWYVPMRLFDEETAEDVYGYVNDNGSGTGFVGPALMKAKGRKSLANLNILAQIGVMGEHSINRAARNGIKQALMRFVDNNEKAPVGERLVTEMKPWFEKVFVGGVETWEERYPQIPEDATPLEVSQAVAKFESDMKTKEANGEAKQGTRRDNINYKFADKAHRPQHIVDVWVNGKKKSYVINGNPRAAQAINGMLDHKSVNNWFSISNRWLSQVCTSYNPEFTLRNTIRDFGFATHTLLGKEGAAYTMKFEKHYAALGFAPIINAAKGVGNGSLKDVKNALAISLFKQYKNGTLDVTKSKYHKWFKEFMDNGGETGYLQMKNVDAWKKQIENDIKDMHKGKLKKLHPIKAVGGFVEDMNEMAENIARFATFCASRESGRNVTRAAYDAKEVSVNFNRSGSAENVRSYKYENMSGKAEKARAAFGFSSSYLRNYTMFFNASVQSFKGLYRNVKNAPVRTIASMVAEPIALGLMMPMINQMLYAVLDDDEKDRNGVKDPYLELPEYERRYNLCIYAGKGRFVKIPIAVEGRAFYGLGDIAASYTYKKDLKESRSLTLDIANQLAQIVPVGSFLESSATSGDSNAFLTSLGSTFLPSTISAAIELIGNRDWKGQPIYNDATYMENAPAWKKAYKGTNELFLWANKKANAWTNDVDPGNENMKGSTAADVVTNPFVWEQVFNSYVGGMGTFATRMGVTIKHALSKDSEVEVKDIPFIRSLLYTPNSQTSLQRTKSKWYNYKDEVETTNYNLTQLKHDSKDPMIGLESTAAYFKYINSPKSEEVNIVNDYDGRIKKLNKILKVVTDEETRKDIEAEKDKLMKEAVEKLDKLE